MSKALTATQHKPSLTEKDMLTGGRLHCCFSRVVAMSSTLALRLCSASPANFLSFQTSAPRLGSYLALPAFGCGERGGRWVADWQGVHSNQQQTI